jgi:hypothetical protein
MSLLDLVLGDRAGSFLVASCLLVATLTIISAILDLSLRSLHEAGYAQSSSSQSRSLLRIAQALALAAALLTFAGAGLQAYLASSPVPVDSNFLLLWLITNVSFVVAVGILGLAPPLTRHWGLSLGAFGLGLAVMFLLLGAVLQLPFSITGELRPESSRVIFALEAGGILLALGISVAAILSLLTRIIRTTFELAKEHRRHSDWLSSDWNTNRTLWLRRARSRPAARALETKTSQSSSAGVPEPPP